MSKTKQRKDQAYYEGYHDGRKGRIYRWKNHPFLGCYHRGYLEGQKIRTSNLPIEAIDDL